MKKEIKIICQDKTIWKIFLLVFASLVILGMLATWLAIKTYLRASLCKILISSFGHKMDLAHNLSVDFF